MRLTFVPGQVAAHVGGKAVIELWFSRFSAAIAKADTPEEVRQQFIAAAADCGFDSIACGEIDLQDRRRSAFFINTWPKAWFDYYQREAVHEFDPILARVRKQTGAFAWSDIAARSQRELQLFEKIKQFGWVDGLAISLKRTSNFIALISLTSKQVVPKGDARALIVLYFTLAYEKYRALSDGTKVLNRAGLTKREVECLGLIAKGATDPDIARRLGIAATTVHEYVESAKKKLDCRTRAQMIAVSVKIGLISV